MTETIGAAVAYAIDNLPPNWSMRSQMFRGKVSISLFDPSGRVTHFEGDRLAVDLRAAVDAALGREGSD